MIHDAQDLGSPAPTLPQHYHTPTQTHIATPILQNLSLQCLYSYTYPTLLQLLHLTFPGSCRYSEGRFSESRYSESR